MNYYFVKYESNWADEMYVYGLALLTESDKEFFDDLTQKNLPVTHYVGTNEEIKYKDLKTLLKCYSWTPINFTEYETLKRFIDENYGHFFYPELDEDDYF